MQTVQPKLAHRFTLNKKLLAMHRQSTDFSVSSAHGTVTTGSYVKLLLLTGFVPSVSVCVCSGTAGLIVAYGPSGSRKSGVWMYSTSTWLISAARLTSFISEWAKVSGIGESMYSSETMQLREVKNRRRAPSGHLHTRDLQNNVCSS